MLIYGDLKHPRCEIIRPLNVSLLHPYRSLPHQISPSGGIGRLYRAPISLGSLGLNIPGRITNHLVRVSPISPLYTLYDRLASFRTIILIMKERPRRRR